MRQAETQVLVKRIPEPEEVRRQLAENLRETRLLRQLLRVAESAAKDRGQRKGVAR
ncbi:MAG: hypothetical protein ABSG86_02655 [Thermoguttaceae bacterium]|jgi:cation transport regulator ChaB